MRKKVKTYKYKNPLDGILLPPQWLAEEIYKKAIERIKKRDQKNREEVEIK